MSFKLLEDKGFIEKIHSGGLWGKASIFKFVGEYKDYYMKKKKIR